MIICGQAYRHKDLYEPSLRIRWGSFDCEESSPLANRAASTDDYTTIFYFPASMAVKGGSRPPTFPTTELEYVDAARVHELA
ncbi:hypothetical protein Scep_003821 [Stephania cephalantha]|uniref:Uncharacterized protein n=1 Tax=Stephania cephalantha TaxID=152367 RepID=A0AAP0KT63_9MAGN